MITQQEILENFAKEIKELRIASGLTQREVAEAVGVDKHSVSHWERSQGLPRVKQMALLLNLYKVNSFKIGVDETSIELEEGSYYEEYSERRKQKYYREMSKQASIAFRFLKPIDFRKEYIPGPNFFGENGEDL